MWNRWKAGQSLHQVGRAFGKSHMSIQLLLSQHGGIVPAARLSDAGGAEGYCNFYQHTSRPGVRTMTVRTVPRGAKKRGRHVSK
jgi:hypothetical protein